MMETICVWATILTVVFTIGAGIALILARKLWGKKAEQ